MTPTGTEARICELIAQRQQMGIAKYGTTVEDNPLGLVQWLKHLRDQMLDGAVYAQRAIEQLEGVVTKDATPNNLQKNDPHAELRKTWKPGQRWQYKKRADRWSDMLNAPTWDPLVVYRRHPDDKDPQEAEKPWYPDDSGEWVDVPDDGTGPEWPDHGASYECLAAFERASKKYGKTIVSPRAWGDNLSRTSSERIVAYKVVK